MPGHQWPRFETFMWHLTSDVAIKWLHAWLLDSAADDDAFAIQDASEPSPSLWESPGLVCPWHHIDIFTNAMKTHCLISILKAKERFEAILHTSQDVTTRVFQALQWNVFVPQWRRKVKTDAPQKQHERFWEGKQFTLTESGSIEATPQQGSLLPSWQQDAKDTQPRLAHPIAHMYNIWPSSLTCLLHTCSRLTVKSNQFAVKVPAGFFLRTLTTWKIFEQKFIEWYKMQ